MSQCLNSEVSGRTALLQTLVRYPVGWMSQGARNEKRFLAMEQAAYFWKAREP
jgi:hypothetical protein